MPCAAPERGCGWLPGRRVGTAVCCPAVDGAPGRGTKRGASKASESRSRVFVPGAKGPPYPQKTRLRPPCPLSPAAAWLLQGLVLPRLTALAVTASPPPGPRGGPRGGASCPEPALGSVFLQVTRCASSEPGGGGPAGDLCLGPARAASQPRVHAGPSRLREEAAGSQPAPRIWRAGTAPGTASLARGQGVLVAASPLCVAGARSAAFIVLTVCKRATLWHRLQVECDVTAPLLTSRPLHHLQHQPCPRHTRLLSPPPTTAPSGLLPGSGLGIS